jgi:hypothetical protein
MSNKKYNFREFLNEQGCIRIPKIQRDNAQGRLNKDVNEIRKNFVHTLMLVVKGKRQEAELDFIYGSTKRDAFEPLDGQQRLTTLFLLHWMMGVDLQSPNDKHRSAFTYETRNTSVEFCDELVQHDASMFITEAKEKSTKEGHKIQPSGIITARDWFKWEWKYDPTILSMLVMIDSIADEMGKDWEVNLPTYRSNLDNIRFNRLNLGEFGLSDELFIKMNARGKLLSDFDKLKSTLEEELQLQQKERHEDGKPLATVEEEKQWRSLMDGAWIDLFWHKYARNVIIQSTDSVEEKKDEPLKAAKQSEYILKLLLLRTISLELLESSGKMDGDSLSEAAYRINSDTIDNLLYAYQDNLADFRSDETSVLVPEDKAFINFKELMNDVNHLIYKDEAGVYHEITSKFERNSHIEDNEYTLFDSFLTDRVGNDVELVFFAMLLFLRAYPMEREDDGTTSEDNFLFVPEKHKEWIKNIENWVRSMRNILLNDNNNQRIDRIAFMLEAMSSLRSITHNLETFVRDNNLSMEKDPLCVQKFFASQKGQTYPRIDNQSYAEETTKATLETTNSKWIDEIRLAESQPYLWGQIRCLLSWCKNDCDTFQKYRLRLEQILNFISSDDTKIYLILLASFPGYWADSDRLYVFNRDRDNSFKRYLREREKGENLYGACFKNLIDKWKDIAPDATFGDFGSLVVKEAVSTAKPWLKSILLQPDMIRWSYQRRIFMQDGHVVLAQRKTTQSHCYDPIFLYFYYVCLDKHIPESKFHQGDSKDDDPYSFRIFDYIVKWEGTEGAYSVTNSVDGNTGIYTDKEMFQKVNDYIDAHVVSSDNEVLSLTT